MQHPEDLAPQQVACQPADGAAPAAGPARRQSSTPHASHLDGAAEMTGAERTDEGMTGTEITGGSAAAAAAAFAGAVNRKAHVRSRKVSSSARDRQRIVELSEQLAGMMQQLDVASTENQRLRLKAEVMQSLVACTSVVEQMLQVQLPRADAAGSTAGSICASASSDATSGSNTADGADGGAADGGALAVPWAVGMSVVDPVLWKELQGLDLDGMRRLVAARIAEIALV